MGSIPPQELNDKLEKELSHLGSRLMNSRVKSLPEVLELAHAFQDWAKETTQTGWSWTREIWVMAQKITQGLQMGRSHEKALARLSETMTEASQNLENQLGAGSQQDEKSVTKETVAEGTFLIPDDDLPSFKDFVGEAPEHLEAIERNLLSLSRGEKWDIHHVFRAFHTLKGISGFMGLTQMAALSHKSEALLEPFKNTEGKPSEDQVDWLLQACDLVREQVQAIAQGLSAGRFRIVSYERREAFQNPTELGTPLTPSNPPLRPMGYEGQALPAAQAAGEVEKASGYAESSAITTFSPDKVGQMESDSHSQVSHAHDASIRISVEKMDVLLEAVGELAICQSQVSGGVEASGVTGHLANEANRLGKISRQLQEIVISLRMVPIHPLFLRMTRLARDLSRKTGKALQLDLEGGETEIDRRMVESLTEPLVHLIRNAVDHGLEKTEERLKVGKPAEARLKLSARHQGGDFVLELSDDGRGLNFGRLAHQAKTMGFLGEGETPDREKLVALIFEPGFSTAEKITEVSGRGVGLDAVKRKIQSLKGSVVVESETGLGTLFRLRIPLTLALMDGILVRVGNIRYVLPAFQVQGFLAQEGTKEHSVGTGGKWLATRQGNLPLIDLEDSFGNRRDGKLRPVVVQVEAGGKGACLMVDEVLGKQQVVIKELGEGLHDLQGVSGGAILGDGRVGLIVDMEALIGRLAAGTARN